MIPFQPYARSISKEAGQSGTNATKWDSYLKGIVNSINTRMIRVYGYSPTQILFGFGPRYVPGADNLKDTVRSKAIEKRIQEGLEDGISVEEAVYESRLACLDEWR